MTFNSTLFAQNATIDYSNSSLSTSICNVFNTATIQTIGGYKHHPVSGGVSFDGTNLVLQTKYSYTVSSNYGTAYAIEYPFKTGYSYVIRFTGYGGPTNNTPTISAFLFASLPDPNQTTPAVCGPVDQNKWSAVQAGENIGNIVLGTTSATYPISNFTASANKSYLIILASGGTTSTNYAYISSVTITETGPDLTLSPTSLSVVCSNTTTQTFTLSNPNNVTGITSYVWNLGTSPTGWLYNGSPAPSTISTTANYITLTSVCGSVPNNISVNVMQGSTVYKTYTATVTNSAPSLSLSGSNSICSGTSQYQITGLSCNANVTWSSSNTSVATVPLNGNPVTISQVGSAAGTITLTAVVSGLCGAPNQTFTKQIAVGAPTQQTRSSNTFTTNGYTAALQDCNNVTGLASTGYFTGYIDRTDEVATSFTWSLQSKSSNAAVTIAPNPDYQHAVINIKPQGTSAYYKLTVSNSCGSYANYYTFMANAPCQVLVASVPQTSSDYSIAPNPARDEVSISSTTANKTTSSQNLIYGVKIADQQGILQRTYEYQSGVHSTKISIRGLNPGLYLLSVFDGKVWKSKQLIVK